MLIKNYTPWQEHKTLNHDELVLEETNDSVERNYKWLKYRTKSLDEFDCFDKKQIFDLFTEQEKAANEEIELLLKYWYLNKSTAKKTKEQYKQFFFYNWFAYNKWELTFYITKENELDLTYFEQEVTAQEMPNLKPWEIWISREAIRNISWYSFHVTPKWEQDKTKTYYVKWQHDLLEDQHKIIQINGSRQLWKSLTISERALEESFIPNNDGLVWAFQNWTTNVIRNYLRKYIANFPEGTFTEYKSEKYIQNNQSWSKIYFRTLADDAQNILWLTLAYIIVDEWHLISEYIYEDVLKPTLLTTWGRMIILWTPWKKRSWYFYKQMIDIKRGLMPRAKLYEIDITKNIFVDPETRADIMANRDKPSIRRQYFCEWNSDEELLFQPIKIDNFPILTNAWIFVLWIDPARKRDRSWYSLHYVYNWKITTILSWFVPDSHKKRWELQALYYKNLQESYKSKFTKFFTTLDTTWVWDWVASIFKTWWVKIDAYFWYNNWIKPNIDWIEFKVGKAILVNNAIDYIDEEIVEIYEETNKDLIEELQYIEEDNLPNWMTTMTTRFYDDITNSMLTSLFFIKHRKLLERSVALEDELDLSTWVDTIDSIEKLKTKSFNRINKRNKSIW